MKRRKSVHSIMSLNTESMKLAFIQIADLCKGEVIEMTDNWWIIAGDDKVQQRYDILKEMNQGGQNREHNVKVMERVLAIN